MTPGTFSGRCMVVDLSSRTFDILKIDDRDVELFIGGRGLAAKYLFDSLKPGTDPLGPDNILIFTTGILGGSQAPGFSRWMVVTKSPLTGTFMRSVCGGSFGAAIKSNGYEFIAFVGSSSTPVYVLINGDKVEFLDASFLWGKDTVDTQEVLRKIHGKKSHIACIGPAGENLVLISSVIHQQRAAARGGVGAVMGSKKLKAVVVMEGELPLRPADPKTFKDLVKSHNKVLKDHPRRKRLSRFGTTFMTMGMAEKGIFPVKNFQQGFLPHVERISGEAFEKFKVGNYGCYSCTTRCGNVMKITEGVFGGKVWEGPEYETIFAFGGQIYNPDPIVIMAANMLCDILGMDTISTGGVIGFAMELYERGIITQKDTGGLDLSWGNTDIIIPLIRDIAHKKGFGSTLALGTSRASKVIGGGAEKYAMNAKGLELPGYEPRAAKAHGLGYAVSNIGGSHMYGYCRQEISGRPDPIDPLTDSGKGHITAKNQIKKAKEEVLILCNFADTNVTDELVAKLLVAATGNDRLGSIDYLYEVGERVVCLERCFNIREGFSRKDDYLPERFLKEPLENAGPATGEYYREYDTLLDEYYRELGYSEDGIPSAETLRRLKLDDIVDLEGR